jgi:transposase
MYNISISADELKEINTLRFEYPSTIVQKRFHTIYLKAKKISNTQIADIVDIHINSITNYIKIFKEKGIEGLKEVNYGTNTSVLDTYKTSVEMEFKKNPPQSSLEALQKIKELTGLQSSPSRVRSFMKRLGMKFRMVGQIPSKGDPKEQKEWIENKFNIVKEKAENNLCHLFFMDASHFVMGVYLCCLWCFERIFIKSSSGRHRVNVLGALNAMTLEVEYLINKTTINAQVIASFLKQIATKYSDLPIVLVLDNARYQHCKFIEDLAASLNIRLLFLPTYSPNLNIIERLWKFIKKKVLNAKYYEKAEYFDESIEGALKKTNFNEEYKKELKTLLTLKFQVFEESQNHAA